jgi:hypothetical protein
MNLKFTFSRIRQLAPLMIVLVSTVVTVGAYLQALHYPFVFDDESYIVENTKLSGLYFSELWRLFTKPYNDFFEFLPLRDLSYWFDITLFGLNPAAFRLHNIILYLLTLPLVYVTTLGVWRYFRPADISASWAAAAVTGLFALHPSHTEAVVWISGRKDVLSTLFSLLAVWLALRTKREQSFSPRYAAATLLALLAAMLSKASAFAVAPVIAMLWVMFWRDIPPLNRHRSLLLWPFASLLLAACVALIFAAIIPTRIPFYFGIEALTRSLAVLGWLARLAISAESRHFFYPVLEDPYLPVMIVLGMGVLLAAATASGIGILRKRLSLEGFAIIVFFLLCTPSIQLIPYQPPSLVSDRWLALAIWPIGLLVVALAWRLRPMPRTVVMLMIALPWISQTMERPRDWRSLEALIDADIHAYPGYAIPAAYQVINQYTHGLIREAVQTASNINDPELRDVVTGLIKADGAVTFAQVTGKSQETITLLWKLWLDHKKLPMQAKWNSPINNLWMTRENMFTGEWMRLAESFPDDTLVRYNAGLWMVDVHKYQEAITYLRSATDSQRLPITVRGEAFERLGLALIDSGHIAEAEIPLRAALKEVPPELQAYCSLSEVYKRSGRSEEAARADASCPRDAGSSSSSPE